MKKITIACMMLTAVLLIAAATPVFAEYLFLKDGSIVEGKVTNETDASVTVAFTKGGNRTIPRKDLLRTLYRKDFLYRQSVKLFSGETFDGFLVQETQENYTFRKELLSPTERTVKKDDVALIAKKELYNLEGVKQREFSIEEPGRKNSGRYFIPAFILRGSLLVPIKSDNLLFPAYGGGLGFDFGALQGSGFGIGIDLGCGYLQGNNLNRRILLQKMKYFVVNNEILPSINLRFYYDITAVHWLTITPVVSAGISYGYIKGYTAQINPLFVAMMPLLSIISPSKVKYDKFSVSIIVLGGIDLKFNVSKVVSIIVEARYGIIYHEKVGTNQIVSISPGLLFRY